MAEYIERGMARFEFERFFKGNEDVQHDCDSLLCMFPAADVSPVVHGEWVAKNGRIVCDHCEALMAICTNRDVLEENMKFFKENEKFCYNCGAKMDGGKNDAAETQ